MFAWQFKTSQVFIHRVVVVLHGSLYTSPLFRLCCSHPPLFSLFPVLSPPLPYPPLPSHHYFPLHSSSPTPPLTQTLEHAMCATAARREVIERWNRGVKGNPHEGTRLPQTVWRPLPTLSLHCWRWETQTGRAVWLSGSSSSRTASAALAVHR